jgi:hypothetical protein
MEKFIEWWIKKFIWVFLPFYTIYKLGGELLREIFASEGK